MGLMLAEPGFHTRCFVEWEAYPRQCLIAAQRAGYFAPAPIWDDITTFDGRPFRGAFDIILAGYPCQPFSHAGQRKGHDDERHLWPDVARIVREVAPEWVFLENVAGHVSLGAETVLRNLWDMGYTPAAGLFSASETGAPHERLRWFCVAHRNADADAGWMGGGRAERGTPEGEGQGGEWQRLRAGLGGSGERMDNPASPRCADAWLWPNERGNRIESGKPLPRDGCQPMADAKDGYRRIHTRPWPEGCGAPDAGRPVGDVGHPARIGRGEGRAEPGIRSGWDAPASAGGAMADADGRNASTERQQRGGEQRLQPESRPSGGGCAGFVMADASGAEREGQQRGQHHPRGRQVKDGYPAIQGGTGLFPPGPGDAAAWADALAVAPHLAPAAGLADCLAWASNMAAAMEWQGQAAAEPALRRMADGLSRRSRALRLLGNAVVPIQAAYAWQSLARAHGLRPVNFGEAE